MSRNRFTWSCRIAVALLVCVLLLLGNEVRAQAASSDSYSPYPYPDEGQPELGSTDAEELLNGSVPKRNSIVGDIGPKKYFDWKQRLYEEYGLKLSFGYRMLYQHASEIAPFGTVDTALGDWWGLTAKWTPLNKGEDYEGSLVLVAAKRGALGSHAVPAVFGIADVGSLWSTNFGFTSWSFAVEELYWEQWLKKDRLMFRGGATAAPTAMNLFRFKDDSTSFTSVVMGFHDSIPSPAQGPGFVVKWWPKGGSELYLTGVLNDANGTPDDGWAGLDWGSFTKGEYFYAGEMGKYWRRDDGEFDHLWIDVFYVDKRSTRDPDTTPNKAGGGFKLMGSKQLGQWVGFASYTYNTAEGGSTGSAFGRHSVTAGGAYLSPLGIRGEVGVGMIWMDPHRDLLGMDLKDQTGFEVHWKMLVTSNLWLTPGFQYMSQPSGNPTANGVFMPHIKFKLEY